MFQASCSAVTSTVTALEGTGAVKNSLQTGRPVIITPSSATSVITSVGRIDQIRSARAAGVRTGAPLGRLKRWMR